jgi:hypothetical protein
MKGKEKHFQSVKKGFFFGSGNVFHQPYVPMVLAPLIGGASIKA